MTQALINSLNILSDKNVNLANRLPKSEGMDFGKIFESKTGDFSQINQNFNQFTNKSQEKLPVPEKNVYNKPQNNNPAVNQQNNIKDSKDDNLKEQDNNEKDKSTEQTEKNTLYGKIQKFTEENAEEIEELAPYIICTEITDDEDEEDLMSDITADETETTDDNTTITEEDPTMYKELITLENPTTLLMLQSQITQSVKQKVTTEQTENTPESLLNNQTGSQDLSDEAETVVFRQLDSANSKNPAVINNAPKQTTGIKTTAQRFSALVNENMIKELNVEVISSQSAEAEASMGDFMQNSSPEEHTARVMIQGDIKYESVAEAAKNASQVKATNITPSKIIDQITKQMENLFNNSKLNMVLNPGNLGKLNLQLMNTKDGLIAQFTVTTQEARDILMKGLDGLKESLLAQGVNIDNVTVKLDETESEYKQDYTEQENSKGGNKHQGAKKQKEQGKDFEQMMFNLENDGNV